VKSAPAEAAGDFAARVVKWQSTEGRNHLPWQNTTDPYRVWLSEIMLQQTQVLTVVGYFGRFLDRFPNVAALAHGTLDEVLGLWSGLGYYSRARNLHRCAKQVVAVHGGAFPQDAETLQTLPGIGRSTAAAVASLCFGQRVAILDANVKRVVTRLLAFEGDLALAAAERALWAAASGLLPSATHAKASMPRYTQGMMDLGAMVCLPKKPLCDKCPVSSGCKAFAQGDPQRYPVRTRKLKRSSQSIWMLWAHTTQGAVWLAQRPTPGVWAGLYSLPLYDSVQALEDTLPPPLKGQLQALPVFTHVLTHKDLHLHVYKLSLPDAAMAWEAGRWVAAHDWPAMGLPAPVRKLLQASGSAQD
jgi:A/G-specific adenine glycosylase